MELLLRTRLVSLVAARLRQPHAAGFTVHPLTARTTLIDQPVTVPVLRCDDTETMGPLTSRSTRWTMEAALFVAEVDPTPARVV